jgi:hypothetical protein
MTRWSSCSTTFRWSFVHHVRRPYWTHGPSRDRRPFGEVRVCGDTGARHGARSGLRRGSHRGCTIGHFPNRVRLQQPHPRLRQGLVQRYDLLRGGRCRCVCPSPRIPSIASSALKRSSISRRGEGPEGDSTSPSTRRIADSQHTQQMDDLTSVWATLQPLPRLGMVSKKLNEAGLEILRGCGGTPPILPFGRDHVAGATQQSDDSCEGSQMAACVYSGSLSPPGVSKGWSVSSGSSDLEVQGLGDVQGTR